MNNLLLLFGLSIAAGAVLTALAVMIFPRFNLLDFPERYGLSRPRKPYPGGLIFVLFFLLLSVGFPELWFLSASIVVLAITSYIDDRINLSVWLRTIVHLLIAVWIVYNGIEITQIGNPFAAGVSFDFQNFGMLSIVITVLWIAAIQNAMNWFDGLPGLSVGVSGIGFLALGLFGLFRPEVAWEANLNTFLPMCFALAGICVGAFILFFKEKIILGDTGSQVLGLLLAVFSIYAGTKIATTLLVLSLPIIDAGFAILRRIAKKKAPWKGDLHHLHHLLADRLESKKATLVLLGFSAVLGLTSVFFTGILKFGILAFTILIVLGLEMRLLKK